MQLHDRVWHDEVSVEGVAGDYKKRMMNRRMLRTSMRPRITQLDGESAQLDASNVR